MPRLIDACAACHERAPLASSTGDCPCLVCEACANRFMEAYQCGVCKAQFPKDE